MLASFAAMLTLGGCSWFKSASVQASLTNAEVAICADETKAIAALAKSIATTLTCSNVPAIQTSLTAALGNVNVCAWVPASASPAVKFHAMGAVGNLVCPIASSAAVGFMTNTIPTAWGCTAVAEANAMQSALTSICEAAIPI